MARREAVADHNNTDVKSLGFKRSPSNLPRGMGKKIETPKVEKVDHRKGEFIGTGKSTIAPVRVSKCVRKAKARLAARMANVEKGDGYNKPGSLKYRR